MENLLIMEGIIGKSETKSLKNATMTVTNFSIAHKEQWKDKDQTEQEETHWFNCELWNAPQKLVDKLTVGSLVLLLEAKLKTKKYVNKEGVEITSFYIAVNKIKVLAEKKEVKEVKDKK
jgi:single-strand DNA-binding protein